MRELKFRAWHKEQKKMYPAEELGRDQMTLMPDGRGFANISGESTHLSAIDDGRKMIPLQYTGLKDKNGKEIYEGDIVNIPAQWWHNNWSPRSDKRESPIYNEEVREPIGNNLFSSGDWTVEADDCEVIGNIYENPELLKEDTNG